MVDKPVGIIENNKIPFLYISYFPLANILFFLAARGSLLAFNCSNVVFSVIFLTKFMSQGIQDFHSVVLFPLKGPENMCDESDSSSHFQLGGSNL